jgi:hypothetical protein
MRKKKKKKQKERRGKMRGMDAEQVGDVIDQCGVKGREQNGEKMRQNIRVGDCM